MAARQGTGLCFYGFAIRPPQAAPALYRQRLRAATANGAGLLRLAVQPALCLVGAGPPTRAGILARRRLARAVGAADRGVALVVQRVVGHVVLVQVAPHVLL